MRTTFKDQIVILFKWQKKKWMSKRIIAITVGCQPSTVANAFRKLRQEKHQVNMRWSPGTHYRGQFEYNLSKTWD